MSLRYVVRVFDGRSAAHAGPYSDSQKAVAKADRVARLAKKQGRNVSVSVRRLARGSAPAAELFEELDSNYGIAGVYSTGSYGGRKDDGS